jgi:hypothetical protein
MAKIINELTGQAEKQALDELAALEQTLAQTASKAPELAKAISSLLHRRSAASRERRDARGARGHVFGLEKNPLPLRASSRQ